MPKPFTRATERFKVFGIDLNSPVDAVRAGYVPILENVRSSIAGELEPREGLTVINTVSSTNKTPLHSIRRINYTDAGAHTLIVGVGNTISYGSTSFTRATYNGSDVAVDSATPVSMVPYRPDQSTAAWMYLATASSLPLRKICGSTLSSVTQGTVHQVGVAPPSTPPTVYTYSFNYGHLVNTASLGSSPNGWETDGVVFVSAPTLIRRIPAAYTFSAVLYDNGSSGLATIVITVPSLMSQLGPGTMLSTVTAGPAVDPFLILDVFPGSSTSATTIESIRYENSPTNTGLCVIKPTVTLREFRNKAALLIGGNYYQIIEVIEGPNETVSFRCNTGAVTLAASDAITVVSSIRTFAPSGFTATGAIYEDIAAGTGASSISVTGAGTASEKTGWVQITPSTVIDLARFSTNGVGFSGTAAVSDDDYVHFSFRFSDLSKLSQGRIMFDCDDTSLTVTGATNATPIVITTSADHELGDGDTVHISSVGGNTAANGTWYITRVSATTFSLNGSVGSGAYTSGGLVRPQFKKNFYYRAFTANDILLATKGYEPDRDARETAIRRRLQARQETNPRLGNFQRVGGNNRGRDGVGGINDSSFVQDPNERDIYVPPVDTTPASQTTTGDFQWSEIIFRRSDLVPVGELAKRGKYHEIRAVRLELTMTDTTTVWADLNSPTIYGGFKPDVSGLAIPYQYRYRYRVSTTGARSNWSPPSRAPHYAMRSSVGVDVTAPSGAPEVDMADIQRLGGTNTNWLDVGSIQLSATTTFVDKVSDAFARGAAPYSEDDTNYQPWLISDVQFSTTATTVRGCLITTSVALPTSMAKGTPMKINGQDTTFRRTINAAQKLYEIEDSLGTYTNVTLEIPEPILYGQPAPIIWTHNNRLFGCGTFNQNVGTVFYSNPRNFDGMEEFNRLEVTGPSEPLMNGCSFNGRNYVWSTEAMYELQEVLPGQFIAVKIPGGKGLNARYALAVGDRIWFLSRDGIYQTGGGDCVSITDQTLRPLFNRDTVSVGTVNGFHSVDISPSTELTTRLSYYNGYLYFNYEDAAGTLRTLVYDTKSEQPGWWPYHFPTTGGLGCIYGEEDPNDSRVLAGGYGGTNSKLFYFGGLADDTGTYTCKIRTQAFDGGDPRALKLFGDCVIDANSGGASITPLLYRDNHAATISISPTVLSTSTSRTQTVLDLVSGAGYEAKNLALHLSWTSTSARPKLYFWEPSFIPLPETSIKRATYWDDCGYQGSKFFQGIEITTDTDNVSRDILVETDEGTYVDTLTIQHDGILHKAYAFAAPFTANQIRLLPSDTGPWRTFDYRWVWEKEPSLGAVWETQQTSHGYPGFIHLKSMFVSLRSTVDVTLTVSRSEDSSLATYTIPTTEGKRRRVYVPLGVHKGKSFTYKLASTGPGFRLYKDTTTVYVKPWGSNESYANRNAFGDDHGDGKARL